jgi:hypothetical protein
VNSNALIRSEKIDLKQYNEIFERAAKFHKQATLECELGSIIVDAEISKISNDSVAVTKVTMNEVKKKKGANFAESSKKFDSSQMNISSNCSAQHLQHVFIF